VNEHGDQLRTAFETHEHLAPDAADVYSRVQELSRSYQRRRWGVQAGGAVLGVSLIAGAAFVVPGLLPGGQPDGSVSVGAAAAPTGKPAASPAAPAGLTPAEALLEQQYAAYFDAGYDYADAEKLAKIWRSTGDIGAVKAEAGRRLLAGEKLPFKATPDAEDEGEAITPAQQKKLDAYFAAGYNYDDAVKLAKLWKLKDAFAAKVEGGERLLDGDKKLPVKQSAPEAAKETSRVNAFFAAGYDYNDAVKLAKLWKKADPYQAKIEGGKRLLAGDTLPIKP
jgi:hypothetical protein